MSSKEPSFEADRIGVVRQMIEEGWNERDTALIESLVTDDCIMYDPVGRQDGKEGVGTFADGIFTGFSDFAASIDDVYTDGETVICRWTATGTHDGEFTGIPPTGEHVTMPVLSTYEFDGEKIAVTESFWDRLSLLEQVGLAPTPGE